MPRAKRGFTLIEMLIATAVAALIMGTLAGVFYYISTVTPQQGDQLSATNDLRFALDWIQRDGVQSYSFTINATPCPEYPDLCEDSYYYGHFSAYINLSGNATRTVSYRYDCDDGQLVREEWTTEDPVTTNTTIAFHIARCADVTFECGGDDPCEGWHPLTVNMTATLNPDTDAEISETDYRHIEMRTSRW
jgi:prepilin-type N-terminal cleavage/methylation domain-containing protein